MTNKMKLSKAA